MKKHMLIFFALLALLCSACKREDKYDFLTDELSDITKQLSITQEPLDNAAITESTAEEDWVDLDLFDWYDEVPAATGEASHGNIKKLPTPGTAKKIKGYLYPDIQKSPFREKAVNAHNEKDMRGYLYPYVLSVLPENEQEAFKILCEAVASYDEEVLIGDCKIEKDRYLKLLKYIQLDCPDAWVLGVGIEADITYEDEYINSVKFKYKYTEQEFLDTTQKLLKIGASLRSVIPIDATDYEKYVYIHDFLILNTEYVSGASNEGNIVGCLLDGKCTCMGFAESFSFLCREFDLLPTVCLGDFIDSSGSAGHIWNIAPLGDGYMIVDCTGDNRDIYSVKGFEIIPRSFMGVAQNKGVGVSLVQYPESNADFFPCPKAESERYTFNLINTFNGEITTDSLYKEIYKQITNPAYEGICVLQFDTAEKKEEAQNTITRNITDICNMFKEAGYPIDLINYFCYDEDTSLYLYI